MNCNLCQNKDVEICKFCSIEIEEYTEDTLMQNEELIKKGNYILIR